MEDSCGAKDSFLVVEMSLNLRCPEVSVVLREMFEETQVLRNLKLDCVEYRGIGEGESLNCCTDRP